MERTPLNHKNKWKIPRVVSCTSIVKEFLVLSGRFYDVLAMLDYAQFLVVSQLVCHKVSTHLPIAEMVSQNAIGQIEGYFQFHFHKM